MSSLNSELVLRVTASVSLALKSMVISSMRMYGIGVIARNGTVSEYFLSSSFSSFFS